MTAQDRSVKNSNCQKRIILIVLDQVAIHAFKLRPDFNDEQFLHHCILTDQNLLLFEVFREKRIDSFSFVLKIII